MAGRYCSGETSFWPLSQRSRGSVSPICGHVPGEVVLPAGQRRRRPGRAGDLDLLEQVVPAAGHDGQGDLAARVLSLEAGDPVGVEEVQRRLLVGPHQVDRPGDGRRGLRRRRRPAGGAAGGQHGAPRDAHTRPQHRATRHVRMHLFLLPGAHGTGSSSPVPSARAAPSLSLPRHHVHRPRAPTRGCLPARCAGATVTVAGISPGSARGQSGVGVGGLSRRPAPAASREEPFRGGSADHVPNASLTAPACGGRHRGLRHAPGLRRSRAGDRHAGV